MYYGCKLQIWKYNLHERGYILKKLGFTWHTLMLLAEQWRHDQQLCVYYITLHYIILHDITLHYIISYYIVLYYIILYCIILYYIIYYITLHYIVDCMHASNIQCRAWNFAPLNMIVEALESTLGSLAPRFSRLCTTMDLSFRKDLPTGVEVVFRLPDCSFHHVQESQGEQMI